MNNPDERYYRADSVPVVVMNELRAAAERREIPIKEAFNTILLPRIGLGPWDFQLRAEILRGQKRVSEGDFLGEEVEDFGTHIPEQTKSTLRSAALQLGVQIGAAGRLILVGRAGTIERCLPPPKKRTVVAEQPEEVLAG